MTKEQSHISYLNRKQAIAYFESTGELPVNRGKYEYDLHHIDSSLKTDNIERYIQWNVDDLKVITHVDHARHHSVEHGFGKNSHQAWNKGLPKEQQPGYGYHGKRRSDKPDDKRRKPVTEEKSEKVSEGLKLWYKNHTVSEETRKKLSDAAKRQWQRQKGLK